MLGGSFVEMNDDTVRRDEGRTNIKCSRRGSAPVTHLCRNRLTHIISRQIPIKKALRMTSKESPITEFPRSIGKVATRELAQAGYTRFDHLTQVSRKSLLAIHGVGPKSLDILEEELKKRGLGYKNSLRL